MEMLFLLHYLGGADPDMGKKIRSQVLQWPPQGKGRGSPKKAEFMGVFGMRAGPRTTGE